jgi:adhesin transport system outer membrane protein
MAAALVAPAFGPAAAATLDDSVVAALNSHPALAEKRALIEGAADNVREQKSAYFPTIGVQGSSGMNRQSDVFTRQFTNGYVTTWVDQGRVAMTQPLFTGFATGNRVDAAKEREQSVRFELQGSADDVAMKAARAHLNLMRTRELLDIASVYMNAIRARKEYITRTVAEGAGDQAELLQADEILMAARTTRLGYEEAFRQAEADYLSAVGREPDQKLDFGPASWERLLPQSVDQAIGEGVRNSPAVNAADRMAAALQSDADADRGSYFPRIDAELSASDSNQRIELGGPATNTEGLLKLTWSFSTGGGQIAHVDKDLAARREALAKRDEARLTVEHDVRQKFTSMAIVDQQFDLMRDRETADEHILDNLTKQFEGGRQTNLQLINANARLFEARAGRTDAYYRRLLARFELLTSMGRLRDAFPAAVTPAGRR